MLPENVSALDYEDWLDNKWIYWIRWSHVHIPYPYVRNPMLTLDLGDRLLKASAT
jgi:hypothetical protein